jgi:four helix bundle protein
MATIAKFTDLNVWKESHKLTLLVYKYANDFPKQEKFGLISQLKRAVVSIESCIAEGFSRFHYKDRLNFYFDARGSIAEAQMQMIIARDLEYLTKAEFEKVILQSEKVGVILGGLIRSTKKLSKTKVNT